MPSPIIQWFPGHMAKTRRMITENIKNVDLIIEILDARIPLSSKNPEIARLTEGKPRVILLNKASLADPSQSDKWRAKYTGNGCECILTDCVARLVPGVLSDAECYEKESISSGMLEYPQYTRPYEFHGVKVPDVLISGHHGKIDAWREEEARRLTEQQRPDLLEK